MSGAIVAVPVRLLQEAELLKGRGLCQGRGEVTKV
jgi:hypothetical protein